MACLQPEHDFKKDVMDEYQIISFNSSCYQLYSHCKIIDCIYRLTGDIIWSLESHELGRSQRIRVLPINNNYIKCTLHGIK